MALLARLFDFQPATTIVSADVDAEFNQLVNILNGTTTNKDALIKFSDATNPVLRVDQISTGAIQHWLQNGTEKARISNGGALNIGSIAALDPVNRIGINLDTDPGTIVLALRTLNSGDQGIRIIMDAATSTGIPAFTVLDDDGGKLLMRADAGGDIEVPAGHPALISDSPTKRITLGGAYAHNVTTTGNVGAGEDDLHSYTIVANTLANDGDVLEGYFTGSVANNANNKRIRLKFGGTNFFDSGAVAFTNGQWTVRFNVIRLDSDSVLGEFLFGINAGSGNLAYGACLQINGLTFTGSITFKATGEATSNDDITVIASAVRKFNRNISS